MSEFSIVLSEENALLAGDSDPFVDAGFYVLGNDTAFPHIEWTDFPYPVLCMWTENVLRNLDKETAEYTLFFMDGPYRIQVVQHMEDLLLIGINSRTEDRVEFTAHSTVHDLLFELRCAFSALKRTVLSICKEEDQPEIKGIQETISHYERLIRLRTY